MKMSWLGVMCAVVGFGTVCAAPFGLCAEAPPAAILAGVCFSPIRASQNPDCGVLPSRSEIREDLVFVKCAGVANRLRTYSCVGVLGDIPAMCDSIGLECWPGAWLSERRGPSERELLSLIAIGKRRFANSPVLIVGNEVLLRKDMTEVDLIEAILRVKRETGLPVAYADVDGVLLSHPNVVDALDVVLVHLYPYWEGVAIERAVPSLVEKWHRIHTAYPDKRIVIGETGWPSAGETQGAAIPSAKHQARYFREFLQASHDSNMDYFYFALFCEDWKAKQEGMRGANWGIFSGAGRLNPELVTDVSDPMAAGLCRVSGVMPPAQDLAVPAFIYRDGDSLENRFLPTDWMGDVSDLKIDENWAQRPYSGGECLKVSYAPQGANRWAGIYWVGPYINHWGEYPGYVLHGAKRVVFWARGERGDEVVEFKVGGIDSPGKPFRDSFGPVGIAGHLTTEWASYSIGLGGEDLSMVLGGFALVVNARENPGGCTLYLDDIVITGNNGQTTPMFPH